jgi:hypothetical protein
LDQDKGTGKCYIIIFIDMYDMEAREVIHNLAAYLAHHHGIWVYKYIATEYVELDQTRTLMFFLHEGDSSSNVTLAVCIRCRGVFGLWPIAGLQLVKGGCVVYISELD